MRVLANDGIDEEGYRMLQAVGITVDTLKRDQQSLARDIGGFDALIVRSATKVTEKIIDAGAKGRLKIVGRAGVGYDNIDVEAASERGIVVKFAPYGNTNATAELAVTLMLAISRNIIQAHNSLKEGVWKKKSLRGTELAHRTLGIIGCGRVGQRLAELVRGFDMEVIGYDPIVNPESRIKYMSKKEVLKRADYVSLHASGRGVIIGTQELSMMKPTAYLVNVSRGGNLDEKALYDALKKGKIAGAALDVYMKEPGEEGAKFASKLQELSNVILTSHLGASTKEAERKTSVEIAQVIIDFLTRGDFASSVNAEERVEMEARPVYSLFIFHRDTPGAFARIDRVLADSGINIRENPSRQLGKNGYVMTVYLVHQKIRPEVIKSLERLDIVRWAKA